jgi:uncharacterized membrane protein
MKRTGQLAAVGTPPGADRFDRLDAVRGLAIVWMALFHFSFDLNHFGLLTPAQDFYRDPFWTGQRTAIVSLFLLCAGLGQAVALAGRADAPLGERFDRRFWRRWGQVAGCALLVSAGSALMFPGSWISFGVLHGIAAMLLLLRLLAPLQARRGGQVVLLALVALALALPHFIAHPFFDTRWTNWTGLTTRLPVTEDHVPVLPWLGVMLGGLLAGDWLLRRARGVLAGRVPAVLQPLAVLGRWSLSFYMLHQPVLIGGILVWRALAG